MGKRWLILGGFAAGGLLAVIVALAIGVYSHASGFPLNLNHAARPSGSSPSGVPLGTSPEVTATPSQPQNPNPGSLGSATATFGQAGFAHAGPMTYDAADGYVIMVVPDLSFKSLDTWAWDGSRWKELTSDSPVPGAELLAYDPSVGQVVLLGTSTWAWDGKRWQEIVTTTPPRSMEGRGYLVFDARLNALVDFSPDPDAPDRFSIYLFDGHNWSPYPGPVPGTQAPDFRFGAAVAYDPRDGDVVLFGGWNSSHENLADTWTWDGRWHQLQPATSPAGGGTGTMAFDQATSQMVYLLYQHGAMVPLPDLSLWNWDGTNWQELPSGELGSQGPRFQMVYDAQHSALVALATIAVGSVQSFQTWIYSGGHWEQRG